MAAPQNEQEYQTLLAERLATLREIEKVQADIDKMGFVPADQQAYNRLLAERVRLTRDQQRAEAAIRAADPAFQRAADGRQRVDDRLAQMIKQRDDLRERARVERAARDLDLRQRYGWRLGGVMAGMERFQQSRTGQVLGGGLMMAGATVGGMARSGLSGTVEGNSLDYQKQLLNREMASVFKPLTDLYELGVTKLRKFMQGLDETGQNIVMVGALIGGAFGLRAIGGRMLGGLGGMALGGLPGAAMGAMMMGGGGGAAGAVASAAGGGGAMNMAALATTPAMAAAMRTGGVAAAEGAAVRGGFRGAMAKAARFPVKHPIVTAGVVLGTTAATIGGSPSSGDEYRIARGADADALDKMQAEGGVDAMHAEYKRIREARKTGHKVFSGIGEIFGGAGPEHDRLLELERRLTAAGVTPETGKRRNVIQAGASYEEIGSTGRKAAISALNMTAEGGGPGGGDQTVSIMSAILAEVQKAVEMAKNTEKKPEVQ